MKNSTQSYKKPGRIDHKLKDQNNAIYEREKKRADSMSIRDRLRQKGQVVKKREAEKVRHTRQKDKGAR